MGNQTSYVNEQVISMDGKLEDHLECIGSKQHKYLGLIQLWRRDSKSKPSIFSKQSHSGQRHDLNVNEHNDRKKANHPNILQYYGCQSNYLTFKGNILQTKFFFEYIPNTLDNVISFHKKNCSYLEEAEIWKIILQIVSACSFLQKLDLFHGDLNPQTIFIDNSKQVKILYHNAYPEIITSYAKLLAYSDASVYISPQQLDALVNQSVTPKDDPFKTDSFQLGLTLLELMTMTSILEECIDYQRKTIYFKSIMDLLSSARKRYSQQLINFVQRLITFDEQSRPTLSDILFDTNLQQQGSTFLPQSKIRRYTSPPRQPERTNSPPPDMGLSSKSPVLRDLSIQSYFRTPLQRSVSPVLDRSGKYLSPAQSRNTTAALSGFNKTPTKQTILIQSQKTPIKDERGRKLNTVTENSRNIMVISRSPIQNQSRKTSFQMTSMHKPALKLVTPLHHTGFLPPYQQAFYQDKANQKQVNPQQQFSQTLQHFVQPCFNNQENLGNTLPKSDSAYYSKPQEASFQQQHSIPKQQQEQQQQVIAQNQQPQSANPFGKTPQKVPQKGINLLSPLSSNNK
ncbi:unnamed protein product (macronuclear) [Paramecium tetraurelia]|uniref:Protein kinase domain-containing protein n=1 Tax=Paramecium tetraurelia TaxID=5888 RepID=A0CNM2_PARTE|nr:uncharacterized protein GSPATT00008831001 [Paramecium tetraurelia]CAK72389.1 unnamed protein product [Paramecium tetraurelia]|eukprot:XP_001439786.1 hypothetical protein (macronuclear) [Paramecium tetraurelia strain d4-2]